MRAADFEALVHFTLAQPASSRKRLSSFGLGTIRAPQLGQCVIATACRGFIDSKLPDRRTSDKSGHDAGRYSDLKSQALGLARAR